MALLASVLIVDDDPQVRQFLTRILDSDDRFGAVEVSDGSEALTVVEAVAPDAVILDLSMPGLGGVDTLPGLQQLSPKTKILVLSGHTNMKEDVLAKGAHAFLPKTASPQEILDTLARVLGL